MDAKGCVFTVLVFGGCFLLCFLPFWALIEAIL